ncbi:MAG: hypothetical protein ACJ8FY_22545 [Gemmataceae bacterium]
MRHRKSIIALFVLICVAIAGYYAYAARPASLSDEEWDICEVVLRHQIFHSAAAGRGSATAYVEVHGCNPTGAFLDRFRGHQPQVKAGWRFSRGSGVLYRIDVIRRTGVDSAEVDGGYYEGNLSSSGNTYYVVRKDGKWVMEREEMHWISQTRPGATGGLSASNLRGKIHHTGATFRFFRIYCLAGGPAA